MLCMVRLNCNVVYLMYKYEVYVVIDVIGFGILGYVSNLVSN